MIIKVTKIFSPKHRRLSENKKAMHLFPTMYGLNFQSKAIIFNAEGTVQFKLVKLINLKNKLKLASE